MSDFLKKIKIPAIVIVIFILMFFAYTTFFKTNSSEISGDQLQGTAGDPSVPPEEQQFLSLLLKIQNITIDTKVFNDPIFTTLQDDGLAITDQPRGRRNPFAPLGTDQNI